MAAWLDQPATAQFLRYLRALSDEAAGVQLDLPATEALRIAEQKGKRAILATLMDRKSFLNRFREHLETDRK